MTLIRHSLVIHLFVHHTGYPRLRELWAACVRTFALTDPHPRPDVPADLPVHTALTALPESGPLAARRTAHNETQAVIRSHHGVLVLSVAFSPPEPSADSWADLDTQWTRVAGDTSWAVGEARLRLAYDEPSGTGEDDIDHAEPASTGQHESSDIDRAEPAGAGQHESSNSAEPDAVAHGPYAVYREVRQPGDTRRLRVIEIVAPVTLATESDHRTWNRRVDELPPFAAYLLAVAKVGYELRVHQPFDLRELRARADQAVDRGLAALREMDGEASADPQAALRETDAETSADPRETDGETSTNPQAAVGETDGKALADPEAALRLLTGVLAGPRGLTQRHTRLTEMCRTVEIAMATMARHRDSEEGLFADDAELAAWFHQRLDDDLLYLGAARERVREVMPLLHVAAEHALLDGKERLREKEAQSQKEQNNFNLAQAGFIGAVVMVLSAIQAFSYTVDAVPPSVHPAIISALGALALLSTLAAARILSTRRVLDRLVQGAAGLLGAALAWVALSWTHKAATGHPAPILWTVIASAAGFAVGSAVTTLRHRRQRAKASIPPRSKLARPHD